MGEFNEVYPFRRTGKQEKKGKPKEKKKTREPMREPAAKGKTKGPTAREKIREAAVFQRLTWDWSSWWRWETVFFLAAGFLLARVVLLGDLVVVGTAAAATLASARSRMRWPFSLAGIVGLFTVLGGAKLVLLSMVWTGLTLFQPLLPVNWKEKSWTGIIGALLWLLLVEGGYLLWQGATLYGWVALFLEAFLVALLFHLFWRLHENWLEQGWEGFKEDMPGLVILGLCMYLGIPDLHWGNVSLTGVLSKLLILESALLGGMGGGAAMGVVLGVLPSIGQLAPPANLGFYALSGLLGGLFKSWGKKGVLGGFLLGHFLMSLYMLTQVSIYGAFYELIVAMALFWLWPMPHGKRREESVGSSFVGSLTHPEPREEGQGQRVTERLEYLGGIMGQLARTYGELAGAESARSATWEGVVGDIEERVCSRCSSYRLCWERAGQRTRRGLLQLLESLEADGKTLPEQAVPELAEQCRRLGDVGAVISLLLENYHQEERWQRRLKETRLLLGRQLESLSRLMESLAKETEQDAPQGLERKVTRALRGKGWELVGMSPWPGTQGEWQFELRGKGCRGDLPCAGEVARLLGELTDSVLGVYQPECSMGEGERECTCVLAPRRPYRLEVGIAQRSKNGGPISGDACACWDLPGGKRALVISDGMGAGSRAARQSSTALSLLQQLMRTGIDADTAVETLNSLMNLALDEDSFTTLDLALFDLKTLEGRLIKIGAPPSYLKRERKVQILRANSLPLGVLPDLSSASMELPVLEGDLLVMVSDGILDVGQGEEWLSDFLRANHGLQDTQELAEAILARAIHFSQGEARDDISVLAAQVKWTQG